jgi:hypothetical protein
MSHERPRKRDLIKRGLCGCFKSSEAPKDKPSKETQQKNTGNSQTNHTTGTSSNASVHAPSDPKPTSSKTLATTAESSSEAQSPGAIKNQSCQSGSASRSRQPPVTATVKHAGHTEVENKEEQQHDSTPTSSVKAPSLWSTALASDKLDVQERKTLNSLESHDNAIGAVSAATELVEEILWAKKENAWKITIKGEEIVLRDVAMKLLGWLDRFKEIGDTIVQFDPVHAALPWAAFRFLLKVD